MIPLQEGGKIGDPFLSGMRLNLRISWIEYDANTTRLSPAARNYGIKLDFSG